MFSTPLSTTGITILADSYAAAPQKLDMSIEGMRSQQFSIGVFIFMLIGVAVFAGIIYTVAFGKGAPRVMKLGEKMMFGAIITGTVLAVAFGAMQLVGGELF
jgi:hypothetical protein